MRRRKLVCARVQEIPASLVGLRRRQDLTGGSVERFDGRALERKAASVVVDLADHDARRRGRPFGGELGDERNRDRVAGLVLHPVRDRDEDFVPCGNGTTGVTVAVSPSGDTETFTGRIVFPARAITVPDVTVAGSTRLRERISMGAVVDTPVAPSAGSTALLPEARHPGRASVGDWTCVRPHPGRISRPRSCRSRAPPSWRTGRLNRDRGTVDRAGQRGGVRYRGGDGRARGREERRDRVARRPSGPG